jgi:cysteine-rich secretory family protein
MVVGVVRIGAQRASLQQRLTVVLAGTFFATVLGFAVAAASPAPAEAYTPPYYSVELYYLKLVNCTRTGGWVLSDGSCKGYGSGRYSKYVPPLKLSSGLSSVARGWAKKLNVAGKCKHGDAAGRLRAAGYTSGTWGENIGCRDGYKNAHNAVLLSHLSFQAEKSYGGGHWKNIKNSRFKWIGIGVWKGDSRVRLVTDFYSW